ncbi:hypothetical protein [Cytobacillus firmus]|uniref:Uncharacterized protein n=1 Tax=Cytobacillus firmus DS1 TaxID=1307436 RepID=W7L417_CYTFI|nr:hypothetical protein [Cytobacillus firmus]EWG13158.1 hypothetical protein PBF_02005 [Cytobacillus firmus DS1]
MKSKKLFLTAIFALIIIFSNSNIVLGNTQNQLDIEAIPEGFLFNLSNLKPGDRAIKRLTVLNLGSRRLCL